jgi:hypothetical protein
MKECNEMELRCMTNKDLEKTIELALGRIFRLGSRQTQVGDIKQYEVCRDIVMTASEILEQRKAA